MKINNKINTKQGSNETAPTPQAPKVCNCKTKITPQKRGKHGRTGGENISTNFIRGSRNPLIRNSKLII